MNYELIFNIIPHGKAYEMRVVLNLVIAVIVGKRLYKVGYSIGIFQTKLDAIVQQIPCMDGRQQLGTLLERVTQMIAREVIHLLIEAVAVGEIVYVARYEWERHAHTCSHVYVRSEIHVSEQLGIEHIIAELDGFPQVSLGRVFRQSG